VDPFGKLDLFLAVAKDCASDFTKPITTKHQYVFWIVSQSRRMSAMRWHLPVESLAADSAAPVHGTLTTSLASE